MYGATALGGCTEVEEIVPAPKPTVPPAETVVKNLNLSNVQVLEENINTEKQTIAEVLAQIDFEVENAVGDTTLEMTGAHAEYFEIRKNETGKHEILRKAGKNIDFELMPRANIKLTLKNNEKSIVENFVIDVTDLNEMTSVSEGTVLTLVPGVDPILANGEAFAIIGTENDTLLYQYKLANRIELPDKIAKYASRGYAGATESTLNGLTFDGKMPKYPNGQPMIGAIDEPTGIFNENGQQHYYVLKLFNDRGGTIQKIIGGDVAPVFEGMTDDISEHGVNVGATAVSLEGATANNVVLQGLRNLSALANAKNKDLTFADITLAFYMAAQQILTAEKI